MFKHSSCSSLLKHNVGFLLELNLYIDIYTHSKTLKVTQTLGGMFYNLYIYKFIYINLWSSIVADTLCHVAPAASPGSTSRHEATRETTVSAPPWAFQPAVAQDVDLVARRSWKKVLYVSHHLEPTPNTYKQTHISVGHLDKKHNVSITKSCIELQPVSPPCMCGAAWGRFDCCALLCSSVASGPDSMGFQTCDPCWLARPSWAMSSTQTPLWD